MTKSGPAVARLAGVVIVFAGACGSSVKQPDGATSSCMDIQQAYADAVQKAQECTVGASGQCGVQVQAGFWCNCMTWVNGGADTLAAIANQYQAAGCQSTCNGTCGQAVAITCQDDATSSTAGRCKPPMLLNLTVDNNGGTFSLSVGYEIDILLGSVGPDGWGMNVVLSSDAVTVLEITIPAGPVNPGGPTHLYRLKALAAGQVVVQIPWVSPTSDASLPPFMITLDIRG